MKRNKDGTLHAHSHAFQKALVQHPWRGGHDETLAYYKRHTESALGWFELRRTSYENHFDTVLLNKALKALAELATYLEHETTA
jgi:hypothetical protein